MIVSAKAVVAVADAADRRLDPSVGEAFRIADRDVLHATIAVVDQTAAPDGTTIMQCLLPGIEDKPRMGAA
jgi:hypothetical protein